MSIAHPTEHMKLDGGSVLTLVGIVRGEPVGVLPAGDDGRPLNFDFETARSGLQATGRCIHKQPIKGDTVAPRSDMKSEHRGNTDRHL